MKLKKKKRQLILIQLRGSSATYPFTQHRFTIKGVKIPKDSSIKNKYKKLLKSKKYKLDKMLLNLEYELNYIDDTEIRDIIRYKYNDGKTWLQIMFIMNYNNEDTARMKLKRYFESLQS